MRGSIKPLAIVLAISTAGVGCNGPSKRSIKGSVGSSSSEPALTAESTDSGVVAGFEPPATGSVANTPPAKQISFVDRHPLFRKPQQYYDKTNSNKAVKTAAAAFVGVPSGLVGELKQIVVGKPSATPPAY